MADDGYSKLYHAFIREGYARELGMSSFCVYGVLLSYTDNDFKNVWPSNATIARHLGLGVSTVRAAITRLEKAKIVKRLEEKGIANTIKFNDPASWLAGTAPASKRGVRQRASGDPASKLAPNKNNISRTNNNVPPKVEVHVTINNTIDLKLDDAVVAMLNKLNIDLNKAPQAFKDQLPQTDLEKLKYHFDEAMKADTPSGAFIDRVGNKYDIPKSKQIQIAKDRSKALQIDFERFCHDVRKKHKELTAKDGTQYEITNDTTAPLVIRDSAWTKTPINTQKEYDKLFKCPMKTN